MTKTPHHTLSPSTTPVARRPDLVLIRHGETEWTKTHRHTGRTNIPLTDRGRQQAEAIAGAIDRFDFAHTFASPLIRAWDTAHLVGLKPVPDRDLQEWDYGDYEGVGQFQ